MDARHAHSPNTAHRSLQRQPKGDGGDEGGARVVWLGRSGDCFVASSPLLYPHHRLHSAHHHQSSPSAQPYELSAEFQQRQVGAIERKYGGARRAHGAALVIQRAFRYPIGEERRGSSPNPALASHIRVRVSQSEQEAAYYHHHQASSAMHHQPPGVRVQVSSRGPRSSSAERNNGRRILRPQPASTSALLRSQGANANLHQPSYTMLLKQQQIMYEHRLDIACPEDPMGAFPSPREDEPWSARSYHPASPALARRPVPSPAPTLSHQLSLPNFDADSTSPDSSTPTSSTSSSGNHLAPESPRFVRAATTSSGQSTSAGRLVSGPIRRTSESPITVLRTASAASTASTSSSTASRPGAESRGTRVSQPINAGPDRELRRKRQYRIALNFFNKKPERGMELLVTWGFVEPEPASVAKFLLTRRGLSKQMVGDYLGQLANPFAQEVLQCLVEQVPMSGLSVDEALRHFLTLFRLPGEAQKIERIIQVFSEWYCRYNADMVRRVFRESDTVFVLAFAIIMLNTDLHTPNLKDDKRMKLDDFLKNLRGIDAGEDIDRDFLRGIYERVKESEFKPGSDHLTQVLRVERSILPAPKKPTLALPHRRLVCYCRLYEVEDPHKKQRELFLFNDLLVVTKMVKQGKRSSPVSYTFRQAHSLVGLSVHAFRNQYYPYGLQLNLAHEGRSISFAARSEDDRAKFMEDLREAGAESEEMEALRIEMELEKQALIRTGASALARAEVQRDSGLPDIDEPRPLRHRALSSSTLELCPTDHAPAPPRAPQPAPLRQIDPDRRLSLNSDSGMSSTASVGSRESSPKTGAAAVATAGVVTDPQPRKAPSFALFGLGKSTS